MKKAFIVFITLVSVLMLSIIPAFAAEVDGGAVILATCTSHSFTDYGGYSSIHNQHTYVCANAGCTAYIVEECYNYSYCGFYKDQDTLSCQRCGKGQVPIHNYEPIHETYDDEERHILTCTNVDPYMLYGQCGKTSGNYEDCSLGALILWRGWRANHGHYLTRTCSVCKYKYNCGYFYPNNHPNNFSVENDCIYCQMGEPYYMVVAP